MSRRSSRLTRAERARARRKNGPKRWLPNSVNVYTCANGHTTVTAHVSPGTTPFVIGCQHDECDLDAQSSFYNVSDALVPTHEWFAPKGEELKRLTEASPLVEDHISRGGLMLRHVATKRTVE